MAVVLADELQPARPARAAIVLRAPPAPVAVRPSRPRRTQGRSHEFTGPIGRPSSALFANFCAGLVEREDLAAARVPALVTALRPRDDGRIDVELDGRQLRVQHVVLANNPARPALPPLGVLHADGVDLRSTSVAGQRICLVGGGLTAVHLALRAQDRGARTTLVTRAPLRPQATDVDPGWLGHALPAWFRMAPKARGAVLRGPASAASPRRPSTPLP